MWRIALIVASICLALPVHAQSAFEDRLTIDMKPGFPEASTPVSLSVRGFSLDIDRSTVTWYVDGTLVGEGEGLKTVAAATGALGTKTTVTVEVLGPEGEFLTATRVVVPAEVNLIWESDSFVPPLYRGRRLPSSGASVRVEAVPRLVRLDGTQIPSRDIVFTWRKNDSVVTALSGRGKSSATFTGPELFGRDTISVEAASLDSTLIAAGAILVPSIDPFVLLYQDHPLFGVLYHRALTPDTLLVDIEVTLSAAPFFAGVQSARDPRLTYAWRVNRSAIRTDTSDPSRLTINAQNSDGSARVELAITHATDYVLDARGLWQLVFNSGRGASPTNLFGAPN